MISRIDLVQALRRANVPGLRDSPEVRAFIDGEGDLEWESLRPDSLNLMEACIQIEEVFDVSLSPVQLLEQVSLEGLFSYLLEEI